jgi:NADH:ubiquinone oxidoreductase subunit 5 (subunit L)/multisubunit Na+/H+ antiporter MnhA subunit
MQSVPAGYQIWLLVCLILAVFGSALTLASFLKFIHAIFLGKRPEKWSSIKEAPFNQWFAGGILAIICIGFGFSGDASADRQINRPDCTGRRFGRAGNFGLIRAAAFAGFVRKWLFWLVF